MTAAMIVLAVLLAVVLLALGLFLFACRRSPVPDFTKPAVIAQWGREDQTEEIRGYHADAGRGGYLSAIP